MENQGKKERVDFRQLSFKTVQATAKWVKNPTTSASSGTSSEGFFALTLRGHSSSKVFSKKIKQISEKWGTGMGLNKEAATTGIFRIYIQPDSWVDKNGDSQPNFFHELIDDSKMAYQTILDAEMKAEESNNDSWADLWAGKTGKTGETNASTSNVEDEVMQSVPPTTAKAKAEVAA
jgi:hypothetical protein